MINNLTTGVRNAAGGAVYDVNPWQVLERFLILGTYGTYYAQAKDQTPEMANKLVPIIHQDPMRFLQTCVAVSVEGRAPKSEPIAVAMALLWVHGVKRGPRELRQAYIEAVPKVFRIGTHIFEWAAAMRAVGAGWGRSVRDAGAAWYHAQSKAGNLSYQMAKYQQRNGWSHHDLLHMLHVSPFPEEQPLFRWAKTGEIEGVTGHVLGMATLKDAADPVAHIQQYRLTHEMIPNDIKNRRDVWEAMLPTMPYMAMVRNLNKLTNLGIVDDKVDWFCDRIQDVQVIKASRVHPFQLLLAWSTYSGGVGVRGGSTWDPNKKVVRSLEAAFYAAFKTVEPTGKRMLLAFDISGSMTWDTSRLLNSKVTAAQGSVAMGMVTIAAEGTDNVDVLVFTGGTQNTVVTQVDSREFHDRTIDQVWHTLYRYGAGYTDCSLPYLWAKEKGEKYDAIVMYTDNESYCHAMPIHKAIEQYREVSPECKAIAVAMAATDYSVVPEGLLNLNMAGFDSAGPSVINSFVGGSPATDED